MTVMSTVLAVANSAIALSTLPLFGHTARIAAASGASLAASSAGGAMWTTASATRT